MRNADFPAHNSDSSDDRNRGRGRASGTDWHVVLKLTDAILIQESRDEDSRIRPIELLASEVLAPPGGSDAEAATFLANLQ
jgi:hypothetical protein